MAPKAQNPGGLGASPLCIQTTENSFLYYAILNPRFHILG
ncbi:hypothetical protein Q31a_41480 [Aureliella helgolandensis]|uniref:Uncharacterized protein n=1 Tax=Aureliella helgolandensis TaxID=2527968 RepID=A0A518GBB0_9BACT|nr:hypothetical protein Q31a_41480 [Aureliella helgolandensis]